MNDLSLCPCCGGKPQLFCKTGFWPKVYYVKCPECGVSTPSSYMERIAKDNWNGFAERFHDPGICYIPEGTNKKKS